MSPTYRRLIIQNQIKYQIISISQNHSSTFVYGPILMKICMNVNIMKTQFFHKCHFYVIEKF